MNKAEALSHFKETYLEPKSTEKMQQVMDYYKDNRDQLVPGFVEAFRKLCIKIKEMQQAGKKEKIGYITLSLLRAYIKDRKYVYVMDAYNEDWFYDKAECREEYDVSWAFDFLDRFANELEDKRKLYIDKITTADMDNFRLEEIGIYNDEIVNLARYAMPKVLELDEYKSILKHEVIEVRVGEYKGVSQVVYKEDTRMKDPQEIKDWLECKREGEYAYEVLRNLDLSGGDYEGIELVYGRLEDCDFSNSNMKDCNLIGTAMEGCKFETTDLTGAALDECSFKNAILRDSIFAEASGREIIFENSKMENVNMRNVDISFASIENAKLKDIDFSNADLFGTSFKNSVLENVVFSNAQLEKVDFTGTKLINPDFDGAYLEDAVFLSEDIKDLVLSEEQRKVITVREAR